MLLFDQSGADILRGDLLFRVEQLDVVVEDVEGLAHVRVELRLILFLLNFLAVLGFLLEPDRFTQITCRR